MKRRNFMKASVMSSVLIFSIGISALAGQKTESKKFVINAGIGGNNTVDLLNRIEKDCLVHQPDLTIITVGTNDMNSRKFISLTDYQKNVETIIDKLRAIGSQVVLITLLPAYEPYLMTRHPASFYQPEGYVGRLKQMNDLLKKIAADNDVALLDLHHVFATVGDIGESASSLMQNEVNSKVKDGIHPTPEGYRLMATTIHEFIVQNGLPRERVVCFGDSITAGDGGVEGKSYPAYLKRLLQY